MSSSIAFVNTSLNLSDEIINSENISEECVDPFQDVSNDIQNNYYRINRVVFAEPLESNVNKNKSTLKDDKDDGCCKEDDTVLIDNVLVQKRKGRKYKKYYINIEDSTNLTCPQSNCTRQFSTTILLKAHIRKVHCADKNSYICDQCGRAFALPYLLVRHNAVHARAVNKSRTGKRSSRTHSGIKSHACSVCGKRFSRKSTLDTHVKFVHTTGELQCTKCPDSFETRSQWTRHLPTHHRPGKPDGDSN